jgi:hypothetical protein
VLARGRTGRLYSRAQGGEGGFFAYQGNHVRAWAVAWPEYGAKGRRRRAACTPALGWLGGAARVRRHCGPWMRGTWRQGRGQEWRFHGAWTGGSAPASAFGPEGGRGERARRDVTSCSAALWLKTIPSTLLQIEFSQIFQTELHQGLTTKLAHLTTPYKFCKGSRVLDQRVWHKLQGNLSEISALVNSESRH